jgi:hypothetical protein
MSRLSCYPNLLLNVGGPEPLLRGRPYLTFDELNTLAGDIRRLDPFDHLLTVHNATGDDVFRGESVYGFGTLQGPKTRNRRELAEGLLRNHHPSRPLFAQETLWPGNTFGHPEYTDEDIRKNAYVMLFCAAMINFGDMDGSSSSGFSNSMNLEDAVLERHAIIHSVWNTFDKLAWQNMKPRPDLVNGGYCLADPGKQYVVYLEQAAPIRIKIEKGPYDVEWIDAKHPDRHEFGETIHDGNNLKPPSDGDWILRLTSRWRPFRERDGMVAFEAEDGLGEWTRFDTQDGAAIRDPGGGRMRYEIDFTQSGDYYVFLYAKQGPLGKDKENDVLLRLDGQKLYGSDRILRPDGMRSGGDWKWTKLPKGPGSHTPDNIRNDAVYFRVASPGVKVFEIIHRSSNYAIDRVMMKRGDATLPTETAPRPTR